MNAPKISHTVLLAKPDSAQVERRVYALKPGFGELGGREQHILREHGRRR